jgi:putative tricarboxylic transport membrane protein
VIIGIILVWPLLFKLIRRNRPAKNPLLPANSGAADYSD